MTDEIIVKKIGDYTVTVCPYNGHFTATKGEKGNETKLRADTLPALEELVKRQDANDRHFKPIEVIHVESGRLGRLTSKVADHADQVYFTWKERPAEKPTRVSHYLTGRWGADANDYKFVRQTPKNLVILSAIQRHEAEIAKHEQTVAGLKKEFESPVKEDDLEGV